MESVASVKQRLRSHLRTPVYVYQSCFRAQVKHMNRVCFAMCVCMYRSFCRAKPALQRQACMILRVLSWCLEAAILTALLGQLKCQIPQKHCMSRLRLPSSACTLLSETLPFPVAGIRRSIMSTTDGAHQPDTGLIEPLVDKSGSKTMYQNPWPSWRVKAACIHQSCVTQLM